MWFELSLKLVFCFKLIVTASLLTGCSNYKNSKESDSNILIHEQKETVSISDDELLNELQKQTIAYFWEGSHPKSGMARERIHLDDLSYDEDVITTGGSGFGLMAIIVGVERGFIKKDKAVLHFNKIVSFLETADRYHGVWPHWLNGNTGKTKAFSSKDNGGDLVETAFLIQGLLTVKAYLDEKILTQKKLGDRIQKLWEEVEWSWYTKNGEKVLYWHWSQEFNWEMNFPVKGYNEALIMYVLAASSPSYPINKDVYEIGWADNGNISNGSVFYNLDTELNHYGTNNSSVGPLFWAHYSFLGLNPSKLEDKYGDYWKLNKNHALIHYKYCTKNPLNHKGYSDSIWGLTSSYSVKGYRGHRPSEDIGVITPTAALSSFPYAPKESMKMLRNLYKNHDSLIGKYGPFDAFSFEHSWYVPHYLAIDQGPIPVMIENYRSNLLWNLFMSNKDVQKGLDKLGFKY